MNNFLMNPWTVTIIGGVVVGLIVYLISKGIATKDKTPPSHATDGPGRKHRITIDKKGRIQSGGAVRAGDKGSSQGKHGTDRQHEIQLSDEGTIVAEGDVVAGDTRDTEGEK